MFTFWVFDFVLKFGSVPVYFSRVITIWRQGRPIVITCSLTGLVGPVNSTSKWQNQRLEIGKPVFWKNPRPSQKLYPGAAIALNRSFQSQEIDTIFFTLGLLGCGNRDGENWNWTDVGWQKNPNWRNLINWSSPGFKSLFEYFCQKIHNRQKWQSGKKINNREKYQKLVFEYKTHYKKIPLCSRPRIG